MSLFQKIVKRTSLKRTLFFVVADVFFIAISVWLAFWLRFDGQIPNYYYPFILRMIALAVIFTVPVFYFQKLYSFSWSYVSASEAFSIFIGVTISFLFLAITLYVSKYFPHFANFPRSIILISYILTLVFCGGLRFVKRIYLRFTGRGKFEEKKRTLIVGAGDAGEQILRSILVSKNNLYHPAGFVDDNPMKQGVVIHGVKVLGKISDIKNVIKDFKIHQMIVALPSAGSQIIRNAVEAGKKSGIRKIKIMPPLSEIIRGGISLKNLRDVDVEDLLGRKQIIAGVREIENYIKNKTILVTGAAGSIGSELSRQIARFFPEKLVLLDQDETGIFNIANELKEKYPDVKTVSLVADITDKNKIDNIMEYFLPKIVFHAAAYKHVPLMENQPDEAVKNNIFGTDNLADSCMKNSVEKFIFVSTDKAVNPTSVMGQTKRVAEMVCQSANQKNSTKFISVRFGNVLNSRGSVIPIFKEQIRRGGPVEVTDPEMKRYFMLISEACLLVMQAGAMGKGGEVFVLDMGKPVKILDLAKDMIRLSGFEPDRDIAIVFTGIRPGEKLFEEILSAEEGAAATQNQKIFQANLSSIDTVILEGKISELKSMLAGESKENLKELLKNIICLGKN